MPGSVAAQAQGPKRLAEDIDAQQQEVGGYVRLKHGAINTRYQYCPKYSTQNARHQQPYKQILIDIPKFNVRNSRDAGSKNLRNMDARTCNSRGCSCCQQKCCRGNAISHPQCPVHHLCEKTYHDRTPEGVSAKRLADYLPAAEPVVGDEKAPDQK